MIFTGTVSFLGPYYDLPIARDIFEPSGGFLLGLLITSHYWYTTVTENGWLFIDHWITLSL